MTSQPTNHIITSPSDLLQLATTITPTDPQPTQTTIRLQLLIPLSSAETLSICRTNSKTHSAYVFLPNGSVDPHSLKEILDLSPLFKAWRSACAAFPFETGAKWEFIFDINLPASPAPGEDGIGVMWSRAEGAGLCVDEGRLVPLVQGIATVMRMRSKGRASFALAGGEEYRRALPSDRGGWFVNLEEMLRKLS